MSTSPELPHSLVKQLQDAMWGTACNGTFAQLKILYGPEIKVRVIIVPDFIPDKVAEQNKRETDA